MRALLIVFGCLLPVMAQSANGTGIDAQENVFGATNVNAVTGHGRLSVGISREGDVTIFSWPGPSYNDQLGYQSSNALDARSQPRFGALEGAGMFLGLYLELQGGVGEVTWLRDAGSWTISQDYGPEDGPNPHTVFVNDRLALTATLVDAVAPDRDVLVRKLTLERDQASSVSGAWLLTYANLSPLPPGSRIPELPVVDWLMDGRNDYAAVWDEAGKAVIHFHPSGQREYAQLTDLVGSPSVDWGPIGEELKQADVTPQRVGELVASLEADYGQGAWMLLTTLPAPDQHQVGFDATPFCDRMDDLFDNLLNLPEVFPGFSLPFGQDMIDMLRCKSRPADIIEDQGWLYPAADAFTDAGDGQLSGHFLAAGEVSEALRTPLAFTDGQAEAWVVLSVASSLTIAREALADPQSVSQAAAEDLDSWLSTLRIPGEGDVRRIARRVLINVRVGTDRETGAVVASLSRQPPYHLDWPRDGAFFNLLLDVSGQSRVVDRRAELYAGWRRTEAVMPTLFIDPQPPEDPDTGQVSTYPADAWEMNYFADGIPGGVFRFEIDTTAFVVWTLTAHCGWVADPESYLHKHWEAIRSGADLLTRWRDRITGMPAPAQEDDSGSYTQTLHGAISVFGALDLAARAARLLGEAESATAWEARAEEVRRAIEIQCYDPEEDAFFMEETDRLPMQASGMTPTGPTAWMAHPFPLYDWKDERIQRQLARDYDLIQPVLNLQTPGGLYFMKNTLALALAGGKDFDQIVNGLPAILAAQATPDTDHFGEVMVVSPESPTGVEQRVSTPHLWESALFYLTALAVEDPEALMRYDQVLPPSRVVLPIQEEQDSGCGCSTGRQTGLAWLLLGLMILVRKGRKHA